MRGSRTIDGLALCKIIVVLAGEKTVSISSYYSLNVPARVSTVNSGGMTKACFPYPPFALKKRPSMPVISF